MSMNGNEGLQHALAFGSTSSQIDPDCAAKLSFSLRACPSFAAVDDEPLFVVNP